MPDPKRKPDFFPGLIFRTNVKILMVVDYQISTVEGPDEFGIGRVARLIDGTKRGCTSFSVDTARREPYQPFELADNAQNDGHISTSFRFDDESNGEPVIDQYDQIWMFGFRPEGRGPTVSNSELRVLTEWMNKGGGVFATGDHEDLGASMCSRIPRVREMRRWTHTQNVPPGVGVDRLDTIRPENADEANGTIALQFDDERDATPQEIEWVPVSQWRNGFRVYRRPHEVLCHPSLGPIDVMPDHAHEGRTRDLPEMDLSLQYDFSGGIAGDEFPSLNGNQSKPQVIATGQTLPAPPSSKPYKGDAGFVQFPMITIYDGRAVGVKGRVATDSTWHHWFDLNIYGTEHATDKTAWRKISRYYENLAVWLTPPGRFQEKCWLVNAWFRYPLLEEFDLGRIDLKDRSLNLGGVFRNRFRAVFGPCTTTRFVAQAFDDLLQINVEELTPYIRPIPGQEIIPPPKRSPDPRPVCLTCPPLELLEEVFFDGMARGAAKFMGEHSGKTDQVAKLSFEKLEVLLDKHFAPALEASIEHYAKSVVTDLEVNLKRWSAVMAVKLAC